MFEVEKYTDIDKCSKWLDSELTNMLKKEITNITVTVSSDSAEESLSSSQRKSLHVWCDQMAKVLYV